MPKYGNPVTDPQLLAQLEGNDNNNLSDSNLNKPQESFGAALSYATPRILGDLAKGIYNTAENIPSYYQSAKTSVPALLSEATQHPLQSGKQLIAGLAEEGQSAFNTPHDVINYLSQRLNLIPEEWNKKVQMARMPSDTESMINATFGQPQNLGQEAARFTGRNIEGLTAAGATLPSTMINLTKSADALIRGNIKPKNVIGAIRESHDQLLNSAKNDFQHVGNEVKNRGISTVSGNVSQLVDQASQYLPNTKSMRNLLNNARTGDYDALRDLQSDLFTKGNDAKNSKLLAEKNSGAVMHDIRDDINQTISNHLKNTGNNDLDNILNQGRDKYKQLQKTYYNDQHRSIQNMVNPSKRIAPRNITNIVSEDSNRMKRLLDANPYVAGALDKYMLRNKAISALKALGVGAGVITGASIAKPLYDIYKKGIQ